MNKNMTTLGKVSERVDALSRNCRDNLVRVEDISFDSLQTVKIANEPHLLRPLAQQSIACRLGIPIHYLRRCPPEMQSYNLNHWIEKEKNEELFFRFDGEEVRAIFTPKYKPVDNFEVLPDDDLFEKRRGDAVLARVFHAIDGVAVAHVVFAGAGEFPAAHLGDEARPIQPPLNGPAVESIAK